MKTVIIFLILTFAILGQDTSSVQDTLMLADKVDYYEHYYQAHTTAYDCYYEIEWLDCRDGIEIGLRGDGTVVWRKIKGEPK